MRKWSLFVLAGVGLALIGILMYGLIYALSPASEEVISKTFNLKKGLTFKKIAQALEREGIIHGTNRFIILGKLIRAGSKIKAGEYEFDLPTSHWNVLQKIVQGHIKTYRITIPEGYTLLQIAHLLEKKEIVSRDAFLKEASSPPILSWYHINGTNLEGYLFPDTYALAKGAKPEAVIRFFLERFERVFSPEMAEQAAEMGLSRQEILTIASIVERETSDLAEKPLVSAVIHNRLRKGIRLQSDPTVIYGISDFNGNLTREDLRRHSPYNTYLIEGLPPGPICNPGIHSIRAALSPAPVDYLYFVSKNDGTHKFSSTLREHDEAVDKYQRHRKRAHTNKQSGVRSQKSQ